ncbi:MULTISPECIES: helix-turn-helix domain-containing protein [Chryseobacterium]|uniref:helix-turn-helix domain-containing protein n=1 Tax=Chryseobacterium TaxID=59732 RepID=UPI00195765C2|nr:MULTISPECIES: AraC family transcriptional regulator [Chryseobacterium]MDH6209814.1 AraC-like DNA-binding protein [Chryseobacterium sp. BIGb0186]WSO08554.1 AraC family transcriptional regulator [Chryseobacterium scophthalmum]
MYSQDYYSKLREKYYAYEENDPKALVYVNQYIKKAKSEKNYSELFQAYKDAILYSENQKMIYADSALVAAKNSGNNDLIGDGYLSKGAIYYFNQRKFQYALEEYLKAYEYLKDSKNEFLKYQNIYHIGVVKSYLGYYDEALKIFNECIDFFETKIDGDIRKNIIFNNTKGYLNSLHQAIICYQMLGKDEQANKLLNMAETKIPKTKDFYLEKSYFTKSLGVSEFKNKNYKKAIIYFDQALPELIKVNDFTWASYIYFYKGKSYELLGDLNLEVENYRKVDSIFNKNKFILPELRSNYEELIEYYRKDNNHKEELYYTNQLLKVDSVIATDFKHLSSRVYKEYDTKMLLETKENLEKTNSYSKLLIFICLAIIVALGIVMYYRIRKQRNIQKNYDDLLIRLEENIHAEETIALVKPEVVDSGDKNIKFDNSIVEKLLNDIHTFENKQGYLEQGITLKKLAEQFKTNTSYLSQVINEYKGSNFNTYINVLRINFATQKIYHDKEWRKYSIEHIASAAGFSNRQSFSNIFLEQNGIRPADFIKKRIKELEDQNQS